MDTSTDLPRLLAELEDLRTAEARASAMLEAALDCVVGMDAQGTITRFNAAAERTFGYRRDQVIGRELAEVLLPFDLRDLHRAGLRTYLATGEGTIVNRRVELRGRRADGTEFPIELTVIRVDAPGEIRFAGYIRDITERKKAQSQVAFLAYHDRLTQLPNRIMFEELLDRAIARAGQHDMAVAVLYLGIDNFRLVNENLGHEAGDELIRQVAARLWTVEFGADVVARLGGDEFLLLVPDLQRTFSGTVGDVTVHDGDNALFVAETVAGRVAECLQGPFDVGGTEIYVTASVGIGLFPLHALDAKSLLRGANAAMRLSKKGGPGGYAMLPGGDGAVGEESKLTLAMSLRKAVEHRRWFLLYQPIVDLVRGDMLGVEALVRWQDPVRGTLLPNDFIPLAEETGLIGAIGDWVVETMLEQLERWRDESLNLDVSLNLSARQLWHPDIIGRMLDAVDRFRVEPSHVMVEVTESAAMIDPDRTLHVLTALRSRGLRFAIDDFGTGYSSLSRLRDLPVDVLKIDRTFIRDLPERRDAGTMVDTMIRLAHSLDMAPLAEGIETKDQWRFLVDHGCRLGQGFYFATPLPAREISALARSSSLRSKIQAQP
jgi:diguanylate cyclase (GGDEF)-like protein/PAS domain S-box-containing protein